MAVSPTFESGAPRAAGLPVGSGGGPIGGTPPRGDTTEARRIQVGKSPVRSEDTGRGSEGNPRSGPTVDMTAVW